MLPASFRLGEQRVHPTLSHLHSETVIEADVFSCHVTHCLVQTVHIFETLSTCSLACKLAASEHQRDGGALLPDVHRATQKLLGGRAALG